MTRLVPISIALVLAVAGCGESARTRGTVWRSPTASGGYGADQLARALLTDVPGYERSESPQAGQYADLAAVQDFEQMRQEVRLDKPACDAATAAFAQEEPVRTAPAALTAFARGSRETVSETLMAVGPDVAERQVRLRVPRSCRTFRAEVGGRWAASRVVEAGGDRIGEESRTVGVVTTAGATTIHTWLVVLRSRGYLATITMYGPGTTRRLAEQVARRAYQQAERILP